MQHPIASRYPDATFSVSEGLDPDGISLIVVVDVPDMGEVMDVFLDRLVDMQFEEQLPVYVLPIHPLARGLATLAEQRAAREAHSIRCGLGHNVLQSW